MAANVTASANDKLIKNLESQLDRLVDQLKDLEECKYVGISLYVICTLNGYEYQNMNMNAQVWLRWAICLSPRRHFDNYLRVRGVEINW